MGDEAVEPIPPSPHWGSVLWGTRSAGWRALLKGPDLQAHGGLDARDVDGTTLLHAAAARGDLPIVAALLHSGADPFIPDEQGRTAVQHAGAGQHEACAAMLALVAERYEYARRYALPNFDVGAALGSLVKTAEPDEQETNAALASQHGAWLASQAAHGKPAPGAPLRALRPPKDLGNHKPKPKMPKWLPEGWAPPPDKPPPPEPEPELAESGPVDDQGRPRGDLYRGAVLSGLSEGGPTWQRYDLAVRVVEVRSTRRPTMLVARVVGSDGKISTVGRSEFTEPGNVRFDWMLYGGLDEVQELHLGIDPASLYDEEAIRLIFDSMDADESGELEPSEVRQLCESLGQRLLSEAELKSALASMDPDGDGTVVFAEFFEWWKNAVGDPAGIFSSLFAMGAKVEKVNLCLPSGGQAIFTPRCWVDVSEAAMDPVDPDEIDPSTGQPFDEQKAKARMYDAMAIAGLQPFQVAKRLKPPPEIDPSSAPKPGGRRGAKNWPGLGDVVELAPDAKPEGKGGEARCMKAGTVGEIVGEASGKGGARKFRVAVMSSKGEGGNVNGKQKKANKGATDGESWYELAELAPHKVESVGYVAQGSLEDQRKAAEAHTLGLGVRGKGSWPLHLLYPDNREILMRLARHGVLTTAQLRNAITATPWAVQGLTDDEIQGNAGDYGMNYPLEAYYSGRVKAVAVGKKGSKPEAGPRPCVLNHRLLLGPGSERKLGGKRLQMQRSQSASRSWIEMDILDSIMETIGEDPLAEFAAELGLDYCIPGWFPQAVALRTVSPPQSDNHQAPPVSPSLLTALLSADLLHLRPSLRAFGLCDADALLPTVAGVANLAQGQLLSIPLNQMMRELRKTTGDETLRPISVPTLQALAGRVAGRQAGLDLTELDGCRLTGRRGTEWDAVPQSLSVKTLDLLADGELSDVAKGVGQPGDTVYIEGNMPLLIVVPHGGAGAQGGKGGGGSVWWNEWAVPLPGVKAAQTGEVGTIGLARAVHAAIGAMTGSTPHIVVNQLRQHWCITTSPRADGVDGEGDIPEGTRGRRSSAAWDNYHTFIEVAKGRMSRQHAAFLNKGKAGGASAATAPTLLVEMEWLGADSMHGDAGTDDAGGHDPWLIGIGLTGRPLRTAVSAGTGRASTGGGAGGAAGRAQILRVFKRFDADGSGSIDNQELRAAAGQLGVELCEQDMAEIMLKLDADGSGQIELQEFEDWFSGLLGSGSGQLEKLQVRAVMATSSLWGAAQRQSKDATPREAVSGATSLGAHLGAFGVACSPSPASPQARHASGVPMQLPRLSFTLLSHGSAAEGGPLAGDAVAVYGPVNCAGAAVYGDGGWGERVGMGLLTHLAAQYAWQSVPCVAHAG